MNYARLVAGSLVAVSLSLAACRDKAPADDQQPHIADAVAKVGAVDAVLPIAEQLDRFRKDTADKPDTLRHASASIKILVTRWTLAVASNDTIALNTMLLDRGEFAWLFYPTSKMSLPPYEAPPQLLWGRLLATSNGGARSVLKAFSSGSFKFGAVNCPHPPVIEGRNRLHEGCLLQVETPAARAAEGAYFGTIIERDGRFKFLSYANRM